MKTFRVGEELTIIMNGAIGRFAAVVTSIGNAKAQEPIDPDMDRDLNALWDTPASEVSPSHPCVKLKYEYGKRNRILKPGEYIIYSFTEDEVKPASETAELVAAS